MEKKWFKRKSFFFTLGYSVTLMAWFSYASISGFDMLSYLKPVQNVKAQKFGPSVHHK